MEGFHESKSFDKRQLEFVLGEGSEHNVSPGVEHALYKMSEGETSELTLQPRYGFGSKGSSELGVPPDAEIKYVVTLHKFSKVNGKNKKKSKVSIHIQLSLTYCVSFKGKGSLEPGRESEDGMRKGIQGERDPVLQAEEIRLGT